MRANRKSVALPNLGGLAALPQQGLSGLCRISTKSQVQPPLYQLNFGAARFLTLYTSFGYRFPHRFYNFLSPFLTYKYAGVPLILPSIASLLLPLSNLPFLQTDIDRIPAN